MFKKKNLKCKDVYGLELNIGDKVIPVVTDIVSSAFGIISDIRFENEISYISLIDEKGNVIYDNILSSYYTTEERLNEKENENVILWINFHSDKGYSESKIPLNDGTKSDFLIPDDTVGISISYDKYEVDEDGYLDSYSKEMYFFGLKRKVSVYLDDDLDEQIISIKSNGKKDWISKDSNVKLCSSFKVLKKELAETIDMIKSNNLNKCNQRIPYKNNKELQQIEKTLKKKN